MEYRTDLAIENRELLGNKDYEGVLFKEWYFNDDIKITHIKILDEKGEKKFGKCRGNYITLETNTITKTDSDEKENIARALSDVLKELIPFHNKLKILIIGLGNEKITPDSLGPHTVSKIEITRHVFTALKVEEDEEMSCVSGLAPGVMGTTGIETLDLIIKTNEIVNPEYVIVIDALAARNIERVSTTIQINDIGIAPGSGLGNYRKELTEKSLGTKVIAIGVPTVIDSNTIILDAISSIVDDGLNIEDITKNKSESMIVTPTDIDLIIKDFSEVIAKGINKTLHPGI